MTNTVRRIKQSHTRTFRRQYLSIRDNRENNTCTYIHTERPRHFTYTGAEPRPQLPSAAIRYMHRRGRLRFDGAKSRPDDGSRFSHKNTAHPITLCLHDAYTYVHIPIFLFASRLQAVRHTGQHRTKGILINGIPHGFVRTNAFPRRVSE